MKINIEFYGKIIYKITSGTIEPYNTWLGWSLYGHLQSSFFMYCSVIQDGCHCRTKFNI